MDETMIKKQLGIEQEYVNRAKSVAELGNLIEAGELLAQARRCKDAIYGLLMEAESDGKGIAKLTSQMFVRIEKTRNHPFAIETQRIYSEGENYCKIKLGEILN